MFLHIYEPDWRSNSPLRTPQASHAGRLVSTLTVERRLRRAALWKCYYAFQVIITIRKLIFTTTVFATIIQN